MIFQGAVYVTKVLKNLHVHVQKWPHRAMYNLWLSIQGIPENCSSLWKAFLGSLVLGTTRFWNTTTPTSPHPAPHPIPGASPPNPKCLLISAWATHRRPKLRTQNEVILSVNIYLLLTKCAACTVSYGASFFPSPCGPSTKHAGHKKRGKNEDP